MKRIAAWIDESIRAVAGGADTDLDGIAAQVRELCRAFPVPGLD
jgi:adenosylmethionine-8-amino-7-oxononanoate aminotransferase